MGLRYTGLVLLGLIVGIFLGSLHRLGMESETRQSDPVVAEVHGKGVPASVAFKDARHRIYELETSLFKLKQQAVDDYLENSLLTEESKRQNLPLDRLLLKEVGHDAGPVTDADVEHFLTEKQIPQGDGKQKEDVREYLKYRKVAQKRGHYIGQLRQSAGVKTFLTEPSPPIVQVSTDGFPSWGSPTAPVTLVEFADFQCPFCAKALENLDKLRKEYGPDKLRIVFRDYPLNTHERAVPAALAAHCAHDQGKFWDFAKILYDNQRSLEDSDLQAYAGKLALDTQKFASCFESKRYQGIVERNQKEAQALGLEGTPAFIVNGVLISDGSSLEALKAAIDRVLKQTT